MRISAKELARQLNVSPSAVSLAMNGRPGISRQTRADFAAAAEAGWQEATRQTRVPVRYLNLVIFKNTVWSLAIHLSLPS